MLQAMNTGHDGSLTTIHANSARDALARLETMVLMTGLPLPDRAIRVQVASAIEVVIQIARFADGSRRVTRIAEITGMEGEIITMQDLFLFQRTGVGPDGRIRGHFTATGIRPRFVEKLEIAGEKLPNISYTPMHGSLR
jgi:pilus assembly protein CpaF